MVVFEYISAINVLSDYLIAEVPVDPSIRKLHQDIYENHQARAFDDYMTMEFPNGTDRSEVISFCIKNDKEIRKNLSLKS